MVPVCSFILKQLPVSGAGCSVRFHGAGLAHDYFGNVLSYRRSFTSPSNYMGCPTVIAYGPRKYRCARDCAALIFDLMQMLSSRRRNIPTGMTGTPTCTTKPMGCRMPIDERYQNWMLKIWKLRSIQRIIQYLLCKCVKTITRYG